MVENRFGGSWTEAKLICLASYLRSYSNIMKNQTSLHRIYIDPFSGPGNRIESDYNIEELFDFPKDGRSVSPLLATEVGQSFDEFYFNDKKSDFVQSLRHAIHTDKLVHFSAKEANIFLGEVISNINWRKSRAVIFLDPFGLHVDWATLEFIATTEAVDIVMLFPTSSLCRMLPNEDLPPFEWQEKLDRFLGTPLWRDFYRKRRIENLFEVIDQTVREANSVEILNFVRKSLEKIFFVANDTFELKNSKGSTLFHILFMCANRSSHVRDMVNRIANGAVKLARREIENGRRK